MPTIRPGSVDHGISTPLGIANGMIVKAPGEKTVYHIGDTDIFSDMGLIAELHEPKIGMVPIGDRFTMGAEGRGAGREALLRASTPCIPCHYASFPLIAAEADAFVEALEGQPVKVLVAEGRRIGRGLRRSCRAVARAKRRRDRPRLVPIAASTEGSMSVDAATVRRIAHLARIAVAEDEVPHLQGELNAILDFVAQLDEVDVDGRRADDLGDADGDEEARGRA